MYFDHRLLVSLLQPRLHLWVWWLWRVYLSTGGTWVQRHSGHTAGPPPRADKCTDPTLGCICCYMSLPVNTGSLRTGNNKKCEPVVSSSLGLHESNMKMVLTASVLFPESEFPSVIPSCLFSGIWFHKRKRSIYISCSSPLWNVVNKSMWPRTKGFKHAVGEWGYLLHRVMRRGQSEPSETSEHFFPSALRSHGTQLVCQLYLHWRTCRVQDHSPAQSGYP